MTLSIPIPTPDEHKLIGNLVEKYSGINIGIDKGYLIQSRLSEFAFKYKLHDYQDVYTKMKNDPKILFEVVELLTTNETSWFRDEKLWDSFEKEIVPNFLSKVLNHHQKTLRIWSAATSTGQEAYSIAIALSDYFERKNLPIEHRMLINILGTDLSTKSLRTASDGIYSELQLERGPKSRILSHMEKHSDGHYQVKDGVRKMVSFDSLNLLDPFHHNVEKFDIVFCRNVLIYFRDEIKKEVLTKLTKSLAPGGVLILGSSEFIAESLVNTDSLLMLDKNYSSTVYTLKNEGA